MNCDKAQLLLLLQDSGELPDRQAPALSTHLKDCAACRAYQDDLALCKQVLASTPPAVSSSSREVMAVIRAAASLATRQHPHWALTPYWKSVLAAAAGLMLCLAGLRLFAPGHHGKALPVATEILPLAALIMGGDDYVEPAAGTSDIAALADQLLILQEMKTEFCDETPDDIMLPEDTLPTTLQWNNTPESRHGKCG